MGGANEATQVTLELDRRIRETWPMLSLGGFSFGHDSMITAKLVVSDLFPACEDLAQLLPNRGRGFRLTQVPVEFAFGGNGFHGEGAIRSVRMPNTAVPLPKTGKAKDAAPDVSDDSEGTQNGGLMPQKAMPYIRGGTLLTGFVTPRAALTPLEWSCLGTGFREVAKAPFWGGKAHLGYGYAEFTYPDDDPRLNPDLYEDFLAKNHKALKAALLDETQLFVLVPVALVK